MTNYKRLISGRLGAYIGNINVPSGVEGVNDNATRLNHHSGQKGYLQQQRMINDKLRSLRKAVYYSYQGADVKLLGEEETTPVRALINPNALKPDYDDKIISIEYSHGFQIGSIFEWCNTKTYWLVYLQDLTELAYFRGDVRKCNYEISWEDAAGDIHSTYAAIRGPVETKIDSIEKNDVSIDLPNYTLHILMPANEYTLAYFKRYAKFYIKGNETCWRIEGADFISTPGIIEFTAKEYYSNKDTDDIEAGIVDAKVLEPQDPNPVDEPIKGETFIKPKVEYSYAVSGDSAGPWFIKSDYPVKWSVSADNVVTLKWERPHSGQFILGYGSEEKIIIVESLF